MPRLLASGTLLGQPGASDEAEEETRREEEEENPSPEKDGWQTGIVPRLRRSAKESRQTTKKEPAPMTKPTPTRIRPTTNYLTALHLPMKS